MCKKYYGKDIVDLLEEIGFLTDKFLAVHCVNLTQRDIDRFDEYAYRSATILLPIFIWVPALPRSLKV